jgi:hypothetical protein
MMCVLFSLRPRLGSLQRTQSRACMRMQGCLYADTRTNQQAGAVPRTL